MTEFDLDRLGDVWRQEPDPAEMERLQKSAVEVSKRARVAQVLDIGGALAVSAAVIYLVAKNPAFGTILAGAAAILVMLFANIRLRKVRQAELRTLNGSTEDMLDQSIDRIETTQRYRRASLIGVGPAVIIGLIIVPLAQGRDIFSLYHDLPRSRYVLIGVGAVILIGALIAAWRALGRGRQELQHLKTMREAYRRERESTDQ